MRKILFALLVAGCSSSEMQPPADMQAGLPAGFQGVFHEVGALDVDGGILPAGSASNIEINADGTYRTSVRGCVGVNSGSGRWELRGADLFLPDDKPQNPGTIVSLLAGTSDLTTHREGSTAFTRWTPGGACLNGCTGGVADIQPCATPAW